LQDGPLFDAFGWYNLDGSRSERSEEIKRLALWANDPKTLPLWKTQPVRGQVGLLLLEGSQFFCYSFYNSTEYYSLAYQGAYEAFLHAGIQADPILLRHIDDYKILYLPFPVSLGDEAVEKLKNWTKAGGTLIAEGCFGFFSSHGHAYENQPSRGINELIGANQAAVHFGPDVWHGMEFSSQNGRCGGGVFRQSYQPTTGTARAWFDDGQAAVVENNFGKGKVRIVGTMAGYGYKLNPDRDYLGFFASALPFAGQTPLIRSGYNSGLIARIWANRPDTFIWCLNPMEYPQDTVLELDDKTLIFSDAQTFRGENAKAEGRFLRFTVAAKDAAVYRLA
jgi:beta-galactosidase